MSLSARLSVEWCFSFCPLWVITLTPVSSLITYIPATPKLPSLLQTPQSFGPTTNWIFPLDFFLKSQNPLLPLLFQSISLPQIRAASSVKGPSQKVGQQVQIIPLPYPIKGSNNNSNNFIVIANIWTFTMFQTLCWPQYMGYIVLSFHQPMTVAPYWKWRK